MGEWTDKAEGKVKDVAGSVTGDNSMQAEGKAQQTKGDVEGVGNDVKNAVQDFANSAKSDNTDSDGTR